MKLQAFNSGDKVSAAFARSFKKTPGPVPHKKTCDQTVTLTKIPTPLGLMIAGATDKGLCLLEFAETEVLTEQLRRIEKTFHARIVEDANVHLDAAHRQLDEYFSGKRKDFDISLDIQGTPFQQEVWKALLAIPYAETCSYKEQACAVGKPSAFRAVANANGDNKISIIIPCHRVIGHDGSLTGYGGGLWRKKYLLEFEARHAG